eukprot:4149916-Prymnesium_polylepis.1
MRLSRRQTCTANDRSQVFIHTHRNLHRKPILSLPITPRTPNRCETCVLCVVCGVRSACERAVNAWPATWQPTGARTSTVPVTRQRHAGALD